MLTRIGILVDERGGEHGRSRTTVASRGEQGRSHEAVERCEYASGYTTAASGVEQRRVRAASTCHEHTVDARGRAARGDGRAPRSRMVRPARATKWHGRAIAACPERT